MNRAQIMLYCVACMLLFLGGAALLFPYAAVPRHTLEIARTPQPMEDLPDVDLGPNFGPVPVTELVGYYLDHPPPKNGVLKREKKFGGC
jgi:hypothetical protein